MMNIHNFEKEPLWIPDEKCGKKLKELMRNVEDKYSLKFRDYWDFHEWTVENVEEFWAEIWDFSEIIYSKSYDKVVDLSIPMEESPKWFEGAKLNIAENLLRFRDDRIAIIAAGEDRDVKRFTFKQLYEETKIYSAALRKLGLQLGDRVACYMSHREEAVIAMLAVTSIGAIWSAVLPTLRPKMFLNCMKQVQPKFLFTIDQYLHNKEHIKLLENIKEIVDGLPSLEKVIIIRAKPESKQESISCIKNSCFLDEFKCIAYETDGTLPDLVFEQVSFSHPAYISYTSGSTGLPKAIVHGFGGFFNAFLNLRIHWNVESSDVWFIPSPAGWASWNTMANLLFLGATIVLFENIPFYLSPTYIWDFVDELEITAMFINPTSLDALEDMNYVPTEKHNLSSLNLIVSGGSIVKNRNFLFLLNKVKKELQIALIYGSTEFMAACAVSDQTLPLYMGEMSTPCLGIAVECLNDQGNQVLGEMGELAVHKPLPFLPLGLWEDTNGEKYKNTYFSKYPGKFTPGDSVIINPITKGLIVCGRSEDTLKQKEYRFGIAEIYSVVKLFPEIKDCLCVGQFSQKKAQRAVLFLQFKKGYELNKDLREKLIKKISSDLNENYVPEVILEAPAIPYNAAGKKTEVIIKNIINNLPHNVESVVNPECLQFYYNIAKCEDL